MAKRERIEDEFKDSSDLRLQQAQLLLKRKNVKYKPLPRFKSGCKNC